MRPFWKWIEMHDEDKCWPWVGARNSAGYGVVRINGINHLAHRVAYERTVGPIPEGLTIDHLCRTRSCCNPAHMEPVTREENGRRGELVRLTRSGGRTGGRRRG